MESGSQWQTIDGRKDEVDGFVQWLLTLELRSEITQVIEWRHAVRPPLQSIQEEELHPLHRIAVERVPLDLHLRERRHSALLHLRRHGQACRRQQSGRPWLPVLIDNRLMSRREARWTRERGGHESRSKLHQFFAVEGNDQDKPLLDMLFGSRSRNGRWSEQHTSKSGMRNTHTHR